MRSRFRTLTKLENNKPLALEAQDIVTRKKKPKRCVCTHAVHNLVFGSFVMPFYN